MPLVAKAGVLWCLVALLALGSWGARACTFHLEEEQIALSKADIVRATTGNLIDSPISLFTHGGETYWILPSVLHRRGEAFVYHAVTKGPLSEPTRELIGDWPEDDFFEGDIGMKWVTNTYQHPDGVLAFVHTEYAGPGQYYGKKITTSDGKTKTLRGPGHSRIGLAWYPHPDPDNTPPTFRYLGHIIQPHREKRFEAWNVHGTPYLIHTINGEEWFYIYFFDAPKTGRQGHTAVARAKVSDVIGAAKSGKTSPWQKFDHGQWTEGLGGSSSPVTAIHSIVHSDAGTTRTGRHILTTSMMNNFKGQGNPSQIFLYDSCTPTNWPEPQREKPVRLPATNEKGRFNIGWQYLSLVDASGADNGIIGDVFWLYAGYQFARADRKIMRFKFRVGSDCACPAAGPR